MIMIACQAWEGMYQGLHGIEALEVLSIDNIEEAEEELCDWGRQESEELIYNFGLEDEYLDEECEGDITESHYYENSGWRGMIIRENAFSSICDANKALHNLGWNLFTKKYCIGEVL